MCEHQGQSLKHNMMTDILNSTTGKSLKRNIFIDCWCQREAY